MILYIYSETITTLIYFTVTIFWCVMSISEIYSLSIFPVFSTVLLSRLLMAVL